MPKNKVALSLDREILSQVDQLVASHEFPSRSQAVEAALVEALDRRNRHRLARECARLDPTEEQVLAEEGLGAEDVDWPEY
jgi:Arc/MetJ-type ribon-helix-helix transcriptional regulator